MSTERSNWGGRLDGTWWFTLWRSKRENKGSQERVASGYWSANWLHDEHVAWVTKDRKRSRLGGEGRGWRLWSTYEEQFSNRMCLSACLSHGGRKGWFEWILLPVFDSKWPVISSSTLCCHNFQPALFTYGCRWLSQGQKVKLRERNVSRKGTQLFTHPETWGLRRTSRAESLFLEKALCLNPVGLAGLKQKASSVF